MKHNHNREREISLFDRYEPLIIILLTIFSAALVASFSSGVFDLMIFMRVFMAGFLLTFSAFKMLDIHGFAAAYKSYDLFAKVSTPYAYAYPVIEFCLGLMYSANLYPYYLNIFTASLMIFNGVGVLIAMTRKKKFKCACLGTAIDLPLSTVTLIEDFGMAAMALFMLFLF